MSPINPSFRQNRRQALFLIAAGLSGCAGITRSKNMVNTEKHFKKFSELVESAAGFITELLAGAGPRTSLLPVPALHQGQPQVAYMICFGVVRPGPPQIWPPKKVGWLDPVTGKRIALTKVSPADFGQTDPADEMLEVKPYKYPNINSDTYVILAERLLELYDVLFAAWAASPSPADQGRLQNQARDFLRIFDQLAEEPLKPYYESLGRDWFGWLRALAQ